ncbi:hypothetical protein DMJ26_23955 [Vibrio parahaemolyticus]|nr:hypothetical protein [Vibrio parahaemolyticus]EGR3325583.1 hypothetical protein [Vibrio parahaemolyticus]
MYITKVVSYKGAWNKVQAIHQNELLDILSALEDFIEGRVHIESELRRPLSRDMWEKALYDRGWELIDRTHYSDDGRRINVGRLGPTKSGLNASLSFGSFDSLSRWLFQQSTLAVKHGLVEIPILIVPVRDFARKLEQSWMRRDMFETNLSQLELLAPLSHQHPFLMLGYSNQAEDACEVTEIEADEYAETDTSIVDRCIEFPPEYHQAGLDILNYFGTYLREQYPEEQASIKIEQQGMNVRMTIHTEDGRSEVVEQALHEYELIVTGQEPPEKFSNNSELVLELKNELRIAQFRLESKQDIIGLQNTRIEQLMSIVGAGLANKSHVAVDFKPNIAISNTITVNQDIASALSTLNELKDELPRSNEAYLALNELEGSLAVLETENDPETVRRAPAMSKFSRLIDRVLDEGSELNSAIKKVESGWDIFKELAGKYNKVAEWCGLPVVPSVLTK